MSHNTISIDQISADQTWPLRQSVMWPNESLDYVKLPKDDLGIHFGLHLNEELVSVISLFVEEGNAQFRKLATASSVQGNGHGTALLTHAMNYLCALKVNRIWCNARRDKTSFYEKFEFIKTGHEFIKSGQHYVIMERISSSQ